MHRVNYLRVINGKVLRRTSVATEIQLVLFRNDESEDFGIFEIQILLQGHLFTLKKHHCDEKTALKEYEELLRKLKISKKD